MVRTNLTSLYFTGLFYVIDGILDISLPLDEHMVEKTSASEKEETSQMHTSPSTSSSSSLNGKPQPARRESVSGGERSHPTSPGRKSRHLFTVKPGVLLDIWVGALHIVSFNLVNLNRLL